MINHLQQIAGTGPRQLIRRLAIVALGIGMLARLHHAERVARVVVRTERCRRRDRRVG